MNLKDVVKLSYRSIEIFSCHAMGESQMEQLTKKLDHSCCCENVSTKAIFSFSPVEFIDKLVAEG
jgi:putative lipase involved disintegration of autophagic bodies